MVVFFPQIAGKLYGFLLLKGGVFGGELLSLRADQTAVAKVLCRVLCRVLSRLQWRSLAKVLCRVLLPAQ